MDKEYYEEGRQPRIMETAGSVLFLLAILVYIAIIVLNITAAPAAGSLLSQEAAKLVEQYRDVLDGMHFDVDALIPDAQNSLLNNLGTAILAQAWEILTAISMIAVFISAKARSENTAGLIILRVMEIIKTVAVTVAFAVLAIAGWLLVSYANKNGQEINPAVVLVPVGVLFLLVFLYRLGLVRSLATAAHAMHGELRGGYSLYCAVVMYISSVPVLLGGAAMAYYENITIALPVLISGLSRFLFAMLLSKARRTRHR